MTRRRVDRSMVALVVAAVVVMWEVLMLGWMLGELQMMIRLLGEARP